MTRAHCRRFFQALRPTSLALAGLVAALLVVSAPLYADEHDHGDKALTFFLGARATSRSGDLSPTLSASDHDLLADLIIGFKHDRLRYLSEYVVEDSEHEFERLQVGVETTANTTLWLGRYHQPASVWNLFYHHGSYLQTSISRPWIESWEDENGVLPQHVIGTLFESQLSLHGGSGLHFSAAAGLPPILLDTQLQPFNQAGHRNVASGSHVAARLEWLPDPVGEDAVGVIASHARLGVHQDSPLLGRLLDQDVLGAFAGLGHGHSRVIATALWMRLDSGAASTTGAQLGTHLAGYAQYDYAPTPQLTLFARQEALSHANGSSYIALFPDAQIHRSLAGARWELPHKQALSVELSRHRDLHADRVNEASLQWSAAWP